MSATHNENPIKKECNKRDIRRLCHFTQSRNLVHIFKKSIGLLSTEALQSKDIPKNINDCERCDGRKDLICCSIEYPNPSCFRSMRKSKEYPLDWVILFIDRSYLWDLRTCFCPCNAAKGNGKYIKPGFENFKLLYSSAPPGTRSSHSRKSSHLSAVPTNLQAEVLVKSPIPLEKIIGIAVQSEEQAKQEICQLNSRGTINKKFYIAPDFFKEIELRRLIQQGRQAKKTLYKNGL